MQCKHNEVQLKVILTLSGGFGISEGTTTSTVGGRTELPNGQG
jgi:hypothetical protein